MPYSFRIMCGFFNIPQNCEHSRVVRWGLRFIVLIREDVMLFRVKLARPLPADRNRPDVLNKRVDYATWFMNYAVVRHCVFVDECGYNISTARSHSRARQGELACRQVCGQRERNLTVTMAISPINGLVFSSAFVGGMNAARFDNFLTQARTNLA